MPNRLAQETSPYLRHHASNPVDWYPWGSEALSRARRENLPIFLSIGYSTCHWCHVMEREVFENSRIAGLLNQRMISIKVDREERPDIDAYFQQVYHVMNQGAGGWPTSIFLTPSLEPIYAATYIPPWQGHGMRGFYDLVQIISETWKHTPKVLEGGAEQVMRVMKRLQEEAKGPKREVSVPSLTDIAGRFVENAASLYQHDFGGFSPAPKFPSPSILNTLIEIVSSTGDKRAKEMAFHTLRCMTAGGMYDIVDGGFCRYSVDDRWFIPHFEKMTYDNALLCQTFARAYELEPDVCLIETARQCARFMCSRMMDGDTNLFFSASDADTGGEEGKYFVFSFDEVKQALVACGMKEDEAEVMMTGLSMTPDGNFQGKNIARAPERHDTSWFGRAREVLQELRSSRPYPFIDRKIITSWNAMMIKALFILAERDSSRSEDLKYQALKSLEALCAMMIRDGRACHCGMAGHEIREISFLEDHAFLADTLITAYESTKETRWLKLSSDLAEGAIKEFYSNGRWLFSTTDFHLPAENTDGAQPSSAAVMVDVLMRLEALYDKNYQKIIRESACYCTQDIATYPAAHATWVCNLMKMKRTQAHISP